MRLDYAHRTFSLPGGLNLDLGNGSHGSLALNGTIANQPPKVLTGPDQTRECTEPGGANVTLDASGSTDPDDDLVATAWWHDGALTSDTLVGRGTTVQTLAPLGTTRYLFTATDAHLATGVGRTRVTVTDTTAPVITDVQVSPPCLWPPNHGMALYELGRDLRVSVDDACDPHPHVRVVSVSSNQPANGGGSGNAPVDVVQGTSAFCVRAERSATLHQDRIYSVVLQAVDASATTRPRARWRSESPMIRARCRQVAAPLAGPPGWSLTAIPAARGWTRAPSGSSPIASRRPIPPRLRKPGGASRPQAARRLQGSGSWPSSAP